MFKVYYEQENVNGLDFFTSKGITIGVKSASRMNHYTIMLPIYKFENIHKDYYVGVKINKELSIN